MFPRRNRGLRPRLDWLDGRCLLATAVPGLTPAQINTAYNFPNAAANAGAGQTVAIVDAFHDPYMASDLLKFDQQFNLPGQTAGTVSAFFSQKVLGDPTQTNDGWAGEEALDVEWVHAVAPGAKIVVVEAASDSLTDLLSAVDTARNLTGVSVVAMSWGGSEFAGETYYDSYFTTPSGHNPVTFLAATGDDSAYAGTEWPATSPNVVAVGGTTLNVSTAGTYLGESAWSGGGGGFSNYESEPFYQFKAQRTGVRTNPDVAIDGDPNTGVVSYATTPSTGVGSWYQVGGTSASTQIWAGLIADADQSRAALNKPTLDTATTLTDLYNSPTSFNDITRGSDGYRAGRGYDLATGLGTPKVSSIIVALGGSAPTVSGTTRTPPPGVAPRPQIVANAVTATTTASITANATTSTAISPIAASTTAAGTLSAAGSSLATTPLVVSAVGTSASSTSTASAGATVATPLGTATGPAAVTQGLNFNGSGLVSRLGIRSERVEALGPRQTPVAAPRQAAIPAAARGDAAASAPPTDTPAWPPTPTVVPVLPSEEAAPGAESLAPPAVAPPSETSRRIEEEAEAGSEGVPLVAAGGTLALSFAIARWGRRFGYGTESAEPTFRLGGSDRRRRRVKTA